MLKLLFSALSLILAGVSLLVVGLVPAVLSGMAWLVGLALFTAVFGALGFLFWMVRTALRLMGGILCPRRY
mgnify:FL=1